MTALAKPTEYPHIIVREDGVPSIADAGMSVAELVEERMAYGWSAEELQLQHPHLTLGQVYAALAYYADHVREIDTAIKRDLREFDTLRRSAPDSPLRVRLRRAGLL